MSIETRRAVVLAKLFESMQSPLLYIQIVLGTLPVNDYVESVMAIARVKRRLDHAWREYDEAVRLYETTRSKITEISRSNSAGISEHLAFLSNSLQKFLQDRDTLYAEHKKLLTDFLLLKAKHDGFSLTIQRSKLMCLEPHIRVLESIDELLERNRAATESTQLKLSFSKAAYQGVLLRLDEISGTIHETSRKQP